MSDQSQGPGWWLASDGKWYPPESAPAAAPPPPQAWSGPASAGPAAVAVVTPTNGMAVAALTLGVVGALFGLIPILFFIALPCGILALIFGVVGRRRARRGAERKGMATAGVVLGVLALVLGVVGIAIVGEAFDDVDDCLDAVSDDIEDGGDRSDEACD